MERSFLWNILVILGEDVDTPLVFSSGFSCFCNDVGRFMPEMSVIMQETSWVWVWENGNAITCSNGI